MAGVERLANGAGRECLGDGDEANGRREAPGRRGCGVDPGADCCQIAGDGHGGVRARRTIYFLSIACRAGSEAFTSAALGPSGATCRYFSSAATASGIAPTFSEAMPS